MSDTNASGRASWSGQLAFVLAAAASAIGLGNLWRFPYLAARYGGGVFIAIYVALVLTLGFTMMLTEIAIGRKTRQSALSAYSSLDRRWGFVGALGLAVPLVIVSYYCVIGGWVFKYFVSYCQMAFASADLVGTFRGVDRAGAVVTGSAGFFSCFTQAGGASMGYATAFVGATSAVILLGVKNGIERSNRIFMPVLFALSVALAAYVVCLPGSGAGLRYYLVPSLDAFCDGQGGFSMAQLGRTILGAMGQMFYSGSLAMGIMIAYGSYMRREDSIPSSVGRILCCDTFIALMAGLMIVPAVYLFALKTGTPVKEAMNVGAGLMFITLPKVFATFGAAGIWVGLAFFLLVAFAALTSAISLFEACVASVCDWLKLRRVTATLAVTASTLALAVPSALGEGALARVRPLGLSLLEFFDFATNSVMMPLVALATYVCVGWVLPPGTIEGEVDPGGRRLAFRRVYRFAVRYFAPLFVTAVLVSEVCRALHIGDWAI